MSASTTAKPNLLTIGHSDHSASEFLALLEQHGVQAVADVRSQPYSRMYGQFNRETLAELLRRGGVDYVFLGRELGARRAEPECYVDGQARYDLIRGLPAFHQGLDRLRRGLATHRIALLCAERDPLTCHRAILVCRELRPEPIDIQHILEDGSLESTDEAESRLLEMVGLPPHLFLNRQALIEQAYDQQARRIAYSETESSPVAHGDVA